MLYVQMCLFQIRLLSSIKPNITKKSWIVQIQFINLIKKFVYKKYLFIFAFQAKQGIEPLHQRWFFGGKLLGDKLHIDEARILPSYVIQVIINPEPTNESWIQIANIF